MIQSVICFGDTVSIPCLTSLIRAKPFCAWVVASIRRHQHPRIRALAKKYDIPFLIQPRPCGKRWKQFLARVKALAPDMLFVHSYSMRLPNDLLALAAHGGVNVHWAPLPQYRGCSPIQWALINGEHEFGVTMHRMMAQFDDGDILCQRRFFVRLEDTWLDVRTKLICETQRMLLDSLPSLFHGKLKSKPQNAKVSSYFPRRFPKDGLFNWEMRVIQIYNLIRALVSPLPGAFYMKGSRRVVLDRYTTLNEVTALKYKQSETRKTRPACLIPYLNLLSVEARCVIALIGTNGSLLSHGVLFGVISPATKVLVGAALIKLTARQGVIRATGLFFPRNTASLGSIDESTVHSAMAEFALKELEVKRLRSNARDTVKSQTASHKSI